LLRNTEKTDEKIKPPQKKAKPYSKELVKRHETTKSHGKEMFFDPDKKGKGNTEFAN